MKKLALACVVGLAVVVCGASAAAGGGNWIDTNRRYLRVGTSVTAHAVFYTRSHAAVIERGPYFAYLAPQRLGWDLPDPTHSRTMGLGRVEILWPEDHNWRGMFRNNPRARITFQVPDIGAGRYVLAFCNRSCSSALGDIDATGGMRVVSTPMEGRLMERVDLLSSTLAEKRYRLGTLRERLFDAQWDRDTATAQLTEAKSRTTDLEATVRRLRADAAASNGTWWVGVALAMAAAALAAIAVALFRARGRRTLLDDELRRLLENDRGGPEKTLVESPTS